jgi:hypothetical protein
MRAAAADCRARKGCIRPEPGRPPGPTGRIAWSLFLPLFEVPGAVFPWCNKHRYLGQLIDWAILGHETSQERLTNARVPSRCRVSARLGRGAVFWVGVRTGAGMGVRVLVRRGPERGCCGVGVATLAEGASLFRTAVKSCGYWESVSTSCRNDKIPPIFIGLVLVGRGHLDSMRRWMKGPGFWLRRQPIRMSHRPQSGKFINTEKQGVGTEDTDKQGFWCFARYSFRYRAKHHAFHPRVLPRLLRASRY